MLGISPHEIESWPAGTLTEFAEYDALQPFGDLRNNWHAAIIAQIIATAYTSSKHKPPSIRDFMWRDTLTAHDEQEQETLNWLRSMKRG